jgi:CO/xanthine dehydrogenase Mo-binding subunit
MSSTARDVALPAHVVANPRLGSWLSVTDDGHVGVRVGKVELGQGILTALAQIAADALRVPLHLVRMLPAHTGVGPDEGLTAGSTSTAQAGPALRHVGAVVLREVTRLAAGAWHVPLGDVEVADGVVRCGARSDSFVHLARMVDPDTDLRVALPDGDDRHRSVGSSAPRLDLPDKVLGRPRYIADRRPAGLMFGRVLRPPSVGATLTGLDDRTWEPGVQVLRDGSFVGVVAPDEAAADRALELLRGAASWAERDLLPDEDAVDEFLRAGPHDDLEVLAEDLGDAGPDTTVLRAAYSRPFLAHASIAPSCGIARWDGDYVHVQSHSQGIHQLRDAIASALGIAAAQVTVEHAENAGCYGHNAADDAAFDAVLLARAVPGHPVQVRWSREDELTWGPLASAMAVDVEARLVDGRVRGWSYDVWSQGHSSRPGYAGVPGLLAGSHRADPLPAPAATDPPPAAGGGTTRNAVPLYDVGPRRVVGHRLTRTPLRTSAMRALGAFTNVFAIESFMDELATAAGADPLAFRLAHLTDPRAVAVLTAAAEHAGWGSPLPEDAGRGIGFARYKDSGAYCAVVAEVRVDHEVHVDRLTAAVDVGLVVNPDGVRNQIEGGATQATSWTLKERVRFDRRRITSGDWESYPILTFREAPRVDVHLLDRPDLPSVGSGEAAQGPTAAAIANAVHAALGVRVRHLPLTASAVVAAIETSTK